LYYNCTHFYTKKYIFYSNYTILISIIFNYLGYKKSEHRSVKAEVKETIQELQECIEVQKKTFTNLQDEYSNYQVVSDDSLIIYINNCNYY